MALKELLKPDKQKLLADLGLSTAWLALVFLHPFFGYGKIFYNYDMLVGGAILLVNFLISLLLFFPMSCGLAYVCGRLAKKKKQSGRWDLAASVFFILFFNPVFASFAIVSFNQPNHSMDIPCGAEITGFADDSAARDAGMSTGEVIASVDGYPADTIDAFKHALAGKNPGDYVSVKTDKNEYRVSVQENQDNSRMIGVILKQRYCPK